MEGHSGIERFRQRPRVGTKTEVGPSPDVRPVSALMVPTIPQWILDPLCDDQDKIKELGYQTHSG